MSILLSSLAVAIAALALKESQKAHRLDIRYLRTNAVNPPLPPLPQVDRPVLPYFLNKVAGGYPYVN